MKTFTQTRSTAFVILTCYKCGVEFGLNERYNQVRRQDCQSFFCPNGHSQAYVESESDRLKAELAIAAKKLEDAETDKRWYAEQAERSRQTTNALYRSNSAMKGVVTRTKNRIANGVCPCCNRTFANLHRHMKGQHPDYTATEQ